MNAIASSPVPLFIDTVGAANILGMSASWLEHDRQQPTPRIPFVRFGARAVRYRIDDLVNYQTAQAGGGASKAA